MVRYPSFTFFFILLSTITAVAMGEDGFDEDGFEARERHAFDGVDANKDGKLSRDEARDLLVFEQLDDIDDFMEIFHDIDIELSEVDKDGDGEVSKDEAILAYSKHMEEEGELDDFFEMTDSNEDGEISWEEFFPEFDDDMSDPDGDNNDDDNNDDDNYGVEHNDDEYNEEEEF